MKKFRLGVPLLLVLLFAGSVYYLTDSRAGVIREYNEKLQQAREAVQNGVLTDGMSMYREALAIHPSVEIYTEAGNVFLDKEDPSAAYSWYEKEFAPAYPDAPKTYEFGIRASLAAQDYQEAFAIYDTCAKREALSTAVKELMEPVWYAYELLYGRYDQAAAFSVDNGLAAVASDGRWGYVNQKGTSVIGASYLSADLFATYAPVVDADGNASYIDASGNTKITASQFTNEDGNPAGIKQFRPLAGGFALAFNGSSWSYYDLETYQKRPGSYADATVIANGVGAVTEDGNTWALIGADGSIRTPYDYEEVAVNDRGEICCADRLFVKKDGTYWLTDPNGTQISAQAYEDADAFYEDSYAAVKKDGVWQYINASGEEQNLGTFEEAKSFSNGMAAVKINGMWGYIDLEGKQAIAPVFYDAGAFYRAGVAFVKQTEDDWSVLRLYRRSS